MDPLVLSADDEVQLHLYRWEPASPPRAVVQIVHGVAEHAGRYAALAAELNAAGYAVWAHDQRGHGRTAGDEFGFLAAKDGWRKCLDDLWLVNRRIALDHPGVPIIVLGHSMGSLMAQQFMSEHGEALAGVVLSATAGRPPLLAKAGRLLARLERLRLGADGKSALIHALTFGAYNKSFAPARTPFDWLSRDPAAVDCYRADPLCGFVPTVQLWIDLLDALGNLATPARLARIPRRLPVHFISGTRDPVSANATGAEGLRADYHRAGLERVTHRFYPDARHELFHETNRAEVTRELIAWLDGTVEAGDRPQEPSSRH